MINWNRKTNEDNHAALRKAYDNLISAGISNLHYLPAKDMLGNDMLGNDGEGTVDGSHPTDLGFQTPSRRVRSSAQAAAEIVAYDSSPKVVGTVPCAVTEAI